MLKETENESKTSSDLSWQRMSCLRVAARARQSSVGLTHRAFATHAELAQKSNPALLPPYSKLLTQLQLVKDVLNRPLTLAEKILYSHLDKVEETLAGGGRVRGEKYLKLMPDRVAMQGSCLSLTVILLR